MLTSRPPLRLPSTWTLTGYFPPLETFEVTEEQIRAYFREDIAQASSEDGRLIVDAGFYPAADRGGAFIVVVVKDWKWDAEGPLDFSEARAVPAGASYVRAEVRTDANRLALSSALFL